MSSIVPPLDYIPKLPGVGLNVATKFFDAQIDKLIGNLADSIKSIDSLGDDIACDDPNITKARKTLEDILKTIDNINKQIAKIQQVINTIDTIVKTAQTIKAAITSAQLLNPVTAPVFIATQLQMIQDATIVNAVEALKQLNSVPPTIMDKLSSLVPVIIDAAARLAKPCDGSDVDLTLPADLVNSTSNLSSISQLNDKNNGASVPYLVDVYDETNSKYLGKFEIVETFRDTDGKWKIRLVNESTLINALKYNKLNDIIRITCPAGHIFRCTVILVDNVLSVTKFNLKTIEILSSICAKISDDVDYNNWVETDFYNNTNVSEEDLEFRSDSIELILKQQRDLLSSLIEAPSEVLKGTGAPSAELGKTGDFYIDLNDNNKVYGPKMSADGWDS